MFIENVGKLSADSIIDEELFIELFDIEDEFTRQGIILKLEDRAKVLNVKGKFTKMLKAYEKSIKPIKAVPAAKDSMSYCTDFTMADGSKVQLRSGVWHCSDQGGVYMLSGENGTNKITACDHPIFPTYILVNAETGINKIGLMYKVRQIWKEIFVDKKTIASSSSIIALADNGIRVTSDNARALVKYLSDIEALNEFDIPEKVSTSRLGWIGDVFMPYGRDEIVFDNEQNMKSLFESIKEVGKYASWLDMIKKLRQEGKYEFLIYMAASFASVLVEPCGGLPFIVALWGDTGKGKTVSLKLATSIWADPSEGAYMTDAKATTTAMEIRLNALNSLPMTLDDLAQIKDQYDGNFSKLVYALCAGRGKDRSNINLGLSPETHWKNCILTNSEHSLVTETMQGGAVNRIIDVEMDSSRDLYTNGNEICKVIDRNYGHAGRQFVDLIQTMGFEAIREIQKKYEKKIKEYAKAHDAEKEEKQIIPMSIIMAADELTEQHIFQDGVRLDFKQCFDILKDKGSVSEHTRAYTYIRDVIITNLNKFDPTNKDYSEVWGRFDPVDQDICIINGTKFSEIMKSAGFQDKGFLRWAVRNGIVEADAKGNPKKISRYDGKVTRCVYFRMDFDEEEMKDNPFK